jgi:hypothetical protein
MTAGFAPVDVPARQMLDGHFDDAVSRRAIRGRVLAAGAPRRCEPQGSL